MDVGRRLRGLWQPCAACDGTGQRRVLEAVDPHAAAFAVPTQFEICRRCDGSGQEPARAW